MKIKAYLIRTGQIVTILQFFILPGFPPMAVYTDNQGNLGSNYITEFKIIMETL